MRLVHPAKHDRVAIIERLKCLCRKRLYGSLFPHRVSIRTSLQVICGLGPAHSTVPQSMRFLLSVAFAILAAAAVATANPATTYKQVLGPYQPADLAGE